MVAMLATLAIAVLVLLRLNELSPEPILAVPLVLFLPGYAFSYALFGRQMLGTVERIVISVTVSIALAIGLGVLLDLTPAGLQTNSWLLGLVVITATSGIVAFARGNEPVITLVKPTRRRLPATDAIVYSLVVVVLVTFLYVMRSPTPTDRISGYTSLWMVPESGTSQTVQLGVMNFELNSTEYRVKVVADGHVINEWQVALDPGMAWQERVNLQDNTKQVDALLFRTDEPGAIYRQVRLKQ
jgi:uncharacterized membrane protein